MIRHCVAHPFGAACGRSSQQAALLEPGMDGAGQATGGCVCFTGEEVEAEDGRDGFDSVDGSGGETGENAGGLGWALTPDEVARIDAGALDGVRTLQSRVWQHG